jgi:hypothetical protein
MSKWTTHVTNFYKEQKKKNPNYQFKNAMKDAKPSYKSDAKSESSGENKKSKKNKSKKNKSKKNKSKKNKSKKNKSSNK